MARVVVVGAGVGGLGAGLALARSGHEVTLVERDAVPVPDTPDEAFDLWRRRGAPQSRHSHAFLARLRNLLRDRSPDLLADLLAAGATEVDFIRHPPPALDPLTREPGDEDLVGLACRRTTFEWVLRRHAGRLPGITVTPGAVSGLTGGAGGPGGVPRVTGVRLDGGVELGADVVVDAAGRRSPLPRWLADLGAGPVPEAEDETGIVYSSRFYRVLDREDEPAGHGLIVGDLGYLKYAVFPGDNGTLSVTFGVHAGDPEMRRILRLPAFAATAAVLPAVGPLVEPDRCVPITGVEVMSGLVNRLRRFVVDGRPLATGVFAVGDSAVCTNPLYGRGCALALVHAELLADTLDTAGGDPVAAAVAFDAATRAELEPWYGAALAQDRHDRAAGDDDGAAAGVGVGELMRDGLLPAARTDPLVFRVFMRVWNLLDLPDAVMRDPRVVARVMAAYQARAGAPPAARPGPDRSELLRLVAGAA